MANTYVGKATATKAGATSGNSTIALNSGLTGGARASVQTGDLVVAIFATGSLADRTLSITDGTDPYTLIATELYSDDLKDTNLRVAYKFMGATPDTTVTFGPTGDADDAGTMGVFVAAGVDAAVFDVTTTTAVGGNTGRPDPPSITPTTAGTFVLGIGASAAATGAVFTSSDLTDFVSVTQADLHDSMLGFGYIEWTSGAVNPAQFGGGTTAAADSWAAMSIALRAASGAYSLTADSGSFTQTGTAADLKVARKVAAVSGAFALTGTAAGLRRDYTLIAASASFAFAGTAAALKATRTLSLASGSFALTGTAAGLKRGLKVGAASGGYTLTGSDADLTYTPVGAAYVLTASSGAFTLTGTSAEFRAGRKLPAGSGSYALTGVPAGLGRGLRLAAGPGSYILSGPTSVLRFGRNLPSASGAFNFEGGAAGFRVAYRLPALSGAYILTGQGAELRIGLPIPPPAWRTTHAPARGNVTHASSARGTTYAPQRMRA